MSEPHFRQRLRGYDRAQVDAFVERTANRFAAVQTAAVPDDAVKETIDRVTEETNTVLQEAYAIAREVTARAEHDAAALTRESQQEAERLSAGARQEAEALIVSSRQDAAEVRRAAESQAAEVRRAAESQAAATVRDGKTQAEALRAEIKSLEHERNKLFGEIEDFSRRLHAVVSQADERPGAAPRTTGDGVETARAVPAMPAQRFGRDEPATAEIPAAVVARERPDAGR